MKASTASVCLVASYTATTAQLVGSGHGGGFGDCHGGDERRPPNVVGQTRCTLSNHAVVASLAKALGDGVQDGCSDVGKSCVQPGDVLADQQAVGKLRGGRHGRSRVVCHGRGGFIRAGAAGTSAARVPALPKGAELQERHPHHTHPQEKLAELLEHCLTKTSNLDLSKLAELNTLLCFSDLSVLTRTGSTMGLYTYPSEVVLSEIFWQVLSQMYSLCCVCSNPFHAIHEDNGCKHPTTQLSCQTEYFCQLPCHYAVCYT